MCRLLEEFIVKKVNLLLNQPCCFAKSPIGKQREAKQERARIEKERIDREKMEMDAKMVELTQMFQDKLNFDPGVAKDCATKLFSMGIRDLHDSRRFKQVTVEDLQQAGIIKFDARLILDYAQQQSVPKSVSSIPKKKHASFISYVKVDTLVEVKVIYDALVAKYPSESHFCDRESHFHLSKLMEEVGSAENVIVCLSPNYVHSPYCLVELITSLRNNVNVVAAKVQKPGLGDFDFQKVGDDLRKGEIGSYLNESGWKVLEDNGLTQEDVKDALQRVTNVKAFDLHMNSPKRVLDAELECLFEGLKF